jgi:hypothetical protein
MHLLESLRSRMIYLLRGGTASRLNGSGWQMVVEQRARYPLQDGAREQPRLEVVANAQEVPGGEAPRQWRWVGQF